MNGAEPVQRVKELAVMDRICGFEGRMERRSVALRHRAEAEEIAGRAFWAR